MSTELSKTTPSELSTTPTTGMSIFDSGAFEVLNRIAVAMAKSSLVPATLCETKEGRLPDDVIAANCFLVVEQSARWGLSPFAVVGCASVVHGRLMWEGKLIAAVLDAKLGVRLDFEYSGSGDNKQVVVSGTLPDEDKPRTITGTVGAWKTSGNNSPWGNAANHERQLAYRGSREWARRHAPSVILGVYTPDEMEEEGMVNVTSGRPRIQARETKINPARTAIADSPAPVQETEVKESPDIETPEFEYLDPEPETRPATGKQTKERNIRTCRFIDLTKKTVETKAGARDMWVVTFHIGQRTAELTTFSETLAENLLHLERGEAVRIIFTLGARPGDFQLEGFETLGETEEDSSLI